MQIDISILFAGDWEDGDIIMKSTSMKSCPPTLEASIGAE